MPSMSNKKSTQDFLEIDQIREGVLVLKNTNLRGVLMVSSINFALKSVEEQRSIIYQFQNFLNSLDFTCQIVCQSRRLNITGYLDKIKDLEEKQVNPLLKEQTADYRSFLENLIETQDVLLKKFFVIVPYSGTDIHIPKITSSKDNSSPQLTEESFQRHKSQLWQRMEFIALGLRGCNLQSIPLTTAELIELFWSLHHIKEAKTGYYPDLPQEIIN